MAAERRIWPRLGVPRECPPGSRGLVAERVCRVRCARDSRGTGNLVVRVPAELIQPYFLTGIGYYTGPYVGSGGKFGTNLGTGARLPLANVVLFSEVRVHHIFAAGSLHPGWYVPLTLGLQVPFTLW